MLKKIFSSRILRITVSIVLFYFAFKKVNILDILAKLQKIPFWFIFLNLLASFILIFLSSYRWNLLLFKKSSWKKVFDLTKANYISAFYNLISPTAAVGDLIKWIPLQKKYPDSTDKTILLGSVLLDRFIGATTFSLVAFIACIFGKLMGFIFPDFIFWFFGFYFLGIFLIYVLVFIFDLHKLPIKNKLFTKIEEVIDLLRNADKKRLWFCLVVSFFCELIWMFPVWMISLFFGSGFTIFSVFIFLPIISLILILPISVAGFGGREILFLYFFSQLGIGDEKILLVSTFLGVIGVLNALFGGLLLFY